MHFKLKNKILVLSFFFISIVFGQQYFSPLIPNNYFSSGADYLAKGGIYSGPFSEHIFNRYGESLNLEIDIIRNSYAERRSIAVIDMFDDVVTQNVYALNRPAFTSLSWSLSGSFNDRFNIPISFSLSDLPYWDFRYDYNEEVRASLGPGVYNRDPVVGYHLINVDGGIRSLEFGMSTKIGSKLKLGFSIENLYEDDIIYTSGVNVIDEDDALASDTTNIRIIDLSAENESRFSFGTTYDLQKNISVGFSFTPSTTIKFLSDGLVPIVDERTLLPDFIFSDSSSSQYKVNLPREINMGFSIQVNNPTKTSITGGLIFKDWDAYDEFIVEHSSVDTANFNYQSTLGFSIGVEHIILGKTPLRFGFIYSESPLGEEFEITKFTIGSGWVYENISIDFSAIFGAADYRYNDLFKADSQEESLLLDRVDESSAILKATIKYSF